MNGWKTTRVWQIDDKLVVAPTIEEAIKVFKAYLGKSYIDELTSITAVPSLRYQKKDYEAIIKEEYETRNTKDDV